MIDAKYLCRETLVCTKVQVASHQAFGPDLTYNRDERDYICALILKEALV